MMNPEMPTVFILGITPRERITCLSKKLLQFVFTTLSVSKVFGVWEVRCPPEEQSGEKRLPLPQGFLFRGMDQ